VLGRVFLPFQESRAVNKENTHSVVIWIQVISKYCGEVSFGIC
jgi:hypothetical protein